MGRDWLAWHEPYGQRGSSLSNRLEVVQRLLSSALDRSPEGRIRLISACAGQGHDVLGVLPRHRRGPDVDAVLVEWDERNVEIAIERSAGLEGVDVRRDDAGSVGAYRGAVPADIVLFCGVFGNITDVDIEGTIQRMPELCAPGATVIWTRHRRDPDVTPTIERWFDEHGFEAIEVVRPDDSAFCVGAHRFAGASVPPSPEPLFRFVGFDELLA